jgi:hypothetical protein
MITPPERLVELFKTLGDEHRLKIIGLLNKQEHNVGEIAALLEVREPTASHHLSKLREMGLVNLRQTDDQMTYRLNAVALHHWKQQVQHIEMLDLKADRPRADDSWIDQLHLDDYDRKVLRDYTTNGRLREIPAKHKKEQAVVRWLITKFEPGVCYSEHQVNAILAQYFEDYVSLRRCLINFGLMQRKRDGSSYWRV